MSDRDYLKAFYVDYWRDVEKVGLDGLSFEQRACYLATGLQADMNSGGLHQFYYNSTGNLAAEAPTILSRIRADRLAQVLTKANALFGDGGPSQDRAKRIDQLDALSAEAKQALEQLTANYYELEEKSGTVGDWLEKHLLAQRSSDK